MSTEFSEREQRKIVSVWQIIQHTIASVQLKYCMLLLSIVVLNNYVEMEPQKNGCYLQSITLCCL